MRRAGDTIELEERVSRLVGARPVSWDARAAPWQPRDAVEGGNARYSVRLEDGRLVFVKAARSEHTAGWLPRRPRAARRLELVLARAPGPRRRRLAPEPRRGGRARELQRRQLAIALEWCDRELELPPS